METFIDKTDDGFAHQLGIFAGKIGGYAATLGLTGAEIAAVADDNKIYQYVYLNMLGFRTASQGYTEFKDLLRYGTGSLGSFPPPPVVSVPPTITLAGVQPRFAALIKKCVASGKLTDAIGRDLGIIAPSTPFDPQAGKPTFKIGMSSGGHPNLIWKKGKFQGIEIHKSLDGVTFTKLDKDFSPDYIDKSALPAPGQSASWYYKLIYLYKDEVVGSYSDVAAVVVMG